LSIVFHRFMGLRIKDADEREFMTQDNGIFIFTSEKMLRIKNIIDQVANTDVTVLIQGESGVGKEVVARSIHLSSNRQDKPFMKVHCAALPDQLLESELFGYEKGAFTGAYNKKPGKFELADGGTIFLDEIGEMSPAQQAKLLQVLQDGEFSRLGGQKDVRVDVRILAATNQNLEESIKEGRFREDLYYRLNAVSMTIPPLRERREEIPLFINYFLNKFEAKYQKIKKPVPDSLLEAFMGHEWIGNVRELENLIHRHVILQDEKEIIDEMMKLKKPDELPIRMEPEGIDNGHNSLASVRRSSTNRAEAEIIFKSLQSNSWNRKKVSELLNVSYGGLCKKIRKYELKILSPI
jgi:two-component system, NtrC family, response regulator AtoC